MIHASATKQQQHHQLHMWDSVWWAQVTSLHMWFTDAQWWQHHMGFFGASDFTCAFLFFPRGAWQLQTCTKMHAHATSKRVARRYFLQRALMNISRWEQSRRNTGTVISHIIKLFCFSGGSALSCDDEVMKLEQVNKVWFLEITG